MKFIVLDASVWVRLSRSGYAKPLIQRISIYSLMPVVNNYMLVEIHNALIKNNWATLNQADLFVDYIKELSFYVSEIPVYRISPDPKDNYLFDLAIQNNCTFIITDDDQLLSLRLKPLPIKSTNWFLKHFPI